ncbi:MAG: hypothetical protein QW046_01675 [Candidatus Micrarchaeaceae archaeon]
MAENELPWDEGTDVFITALDEKIEKSHGFKLRDLLLDPRNYVSNANFAETFDDIKRTVDAYFKELHEVYADDEQKFNADMENVTQQYSKISAILSQKASAASKPYIKPIGITRDTARDENIIIAKYEESLDILFENLIKQSNYVADISVQYGQYTIGSWLFSGSKQYLVSLNPPGGVVFDIQNAESTIGTLLDGINLMVQR